MTVMCTSIVAGKLATKDGTILVARNEDFDQNNWNKYLKGMRDPQYQGMSDENWTLGNGLTVPVPENSYRYCSIPDAAGAAEASEPIGDHYFFEARGINEKNVILTATNSMGINETASHADPVVSPGIEESIIATLILPQAQTALDGIKLLGSYVEKYGAAEAAGICMADEEEAWYMEIGSAHHWAAVKVPQDKYLVVANCMRIRNIDLTDTENVQCSDGLYEFVQEHHLLENADEKDFDFAAAFGYPWSMENQQDLYYNVDRLWLAQHILTPSRDQEVRLTSYPLFLEPDEKLTISLVAKVLRAGYHGTRLEGIATRPIGVVRTAQSHIMVLDHTMPDKLKGTIWQTVGTPLASAYIPLFARMQGIPKTYAMGGNVYHEKSAYWKFRSLFSLADLAGEDEAKKLSSNWAQLEQKFLDDYSEMCQQLKTMQDDQAEKAAEAFNEKVLTKAETRAKKLRRKLLTGISQNQKDK